MQVMCVASPLGWMISARIMGCGFPKVGDILTVQHTYKSPCCNGSHDVYDFEGYDLLGAFDARCFAILPEEDSDDIEAAEQEAIVPNPIIETEPPHIMDVAIAAYQQVYELTGCEQRATAAYYEVLNKVS